MLITENTYVLKLTFGSIYRKTEIQVILIHDTCTWCETSNFAFTFFCVSVWVIKLEIAFTQLPSPFMSELWEVWNNSKTLSKNQYFHIIVTKTYMIHLCIAFLIFNCRNFLKIKCKATWKNNNCLNLINKKKKKTNIVKEKSHFQQT